MVQMVIPMSSEGWEGLLFSCFGRSEGAFPFGFPIVFGGREGAVSFDFPFGFGGWEGVFSSRFIEFKG
jgi:hypothetical protein